MWMLWILGTVLFYARLVSWYEANGYYDDPEGEKEQAERDVDPASGQQSARNAFAFVMPGQFPDTDSGNDLLPFGSIPEIDKTSVNIVSSDELSGPLKRRVTQNRGDLLGCWVPSKHTSPMCRHWAE